MGMRRVSIATLIILVAATVPLVQRFVANNELTIVVIGYPQLQPIRPSVIASGRLSHARTVQLTSEVIGRVETVHVVEGQAVIQGELVLEIEDDALVSEVEQSEAAVRLQRVDIERKQMRIAYLESQRAREESLFDNGLLDEAALEAITHQLSLAEVDLESSMELLAQKEAALNKTSELLEKSSVYSPIDGVVTFVSIAEGETAIASATNMRGSHLMTIADPMHLVTEVQVDETEIASISLGQEAWVTAIAWPDQPLPGTVEFIAGTARTVSGRSSASFTVRIRVENSKDIVLRPGMSCRAEILTSDIEKVLALPLSATLSERDLETGADDLHVFVYRNGTANKQKIEGGLSDDGFIEIRSGLDREDPVIVGPVQALFELRDGDAVSDRANSD